MASEFKIKNGLIVVGDVSTSGTITINGALAATQSWVSSQAYLTSSSLTSYATQSYVTSAIASLVDSAPGALDTLRELATALGNDASFSTTVTNSIASKQNASTAINTSNIASQSVSYATSAGSAGYVNNQSGQLASYDNRTISPSETNASYLQFGFTSWGNNNSAPYADYLHLRSYPDSSGGSDNLVMFLKSGIGMRIYQQTFGSATAYSSYADVWHSGNLTNLNQLTNGPGYITSYTEVDTLATVTGRGATTNTSITVGPDLTVQADGSSNYTASRLWLNSHNNYRGAGIHMSGVGSTWFAGTPYTDFDGGYVIARTGTSNDQASAQYSNALLTVKSTGYVGIATTNPEAKLHIVYGSGQAGFLSRGPSGDTWFPYTNGQNYVRGITNFDNAAVYFTGGNVGIGTTSPLGPLDVRSTGLAQIYFGYPNAGEYGYLGRDANSGLYSLNIVQNANLAIWTNNTERMRITSGGSLLIGSTTQAYNPQTQGYLFGVKSNTTQTFISIAKSGQTLDSGGMIVGLDSTTGYVWMRESTDLTFGTNNSTRVTIAAAGNVGIGTTSPNEKLHAAGNIHAYAAGGIDAGLFASTSGGSTTIAIRSNGITHFNGGNVGIGTSSPTNSLEVQGAANTSIQAIFQSSSGGNAAYSGGIQLGNAAANQKSSIVHDSSGDNTLTFTSHYSGGSANKFIFAPGGTERVRFQQNGNVGIGMSPASNERFSVNAAEGIWALSAYRSGVQIGGIHLNDSILNIQGSGGSEVRLSTTGNATWNGDILATRAWVGSQGYLTSVSDIWVNTTGDTMTGSLSFSEASVIKKRFTTSTSNPVKTASGVLTSRSDNSGGYTYYVIETNVPQDDYQMGGFTIEIFGNYSSTNHKTKIDLGGYWNPESNGGFIGFEAHGSNPQYKPTIEVARNTSGKTVFIIYGVSWNYPVIVARDLWLGYTGSDGGTYGEGWSIIGTSDISSYVNRDTVVWRNAYSDSNPAGYLTSYTETDTLASVTGRGATTSTNISVNNAKIGTDGTYGGGYSTIGFGGTTNGYNRVFGQVGTSDGLFLASATGRGIYFRVNGGSTDNVTINSSGNVAINTANFTYANGDNASVISGVVPTANKLFIDGSIQLLNNTDAIVIGRGASTFLTDEELGFGWGSGWYMIDGSYLRVRNNISVYSTGSFYGNIFYDVNDTAYYVDPHSTSNLNNLSVVGYQYIGGQTSNGQSNYQWDGATYRNPDQWTARLILRRDNATTGINGSIPSLVIFNNNGANQTTASMVFATNECVTGSNSVNLAGIIAKKESVGNCGGWSAGSLNFFVKNYGARVDSLALTSDGNATFSGIVYSTGYGNSTQWNTAYGWGNHATAGYLTSLPSHTHDDRYFTETESDARYPLSRDALGTTTNVGDATGFGNNLASGTYTRGYVGHSGQVWVSHDTGGSVGNFALEVTYYGAMYVHTNVDSSSWGTKQIWTSEAFANNSSNWNTAYSWGNHASYSYATTSYVTTQINNLIAGAPGALDTLDELAAALGDDSNFATTVTNSIAGKVSKAGDTMTSSGQQVLNIFHGAATGDFNDALFVKNTVSAQQVQIGMATTGSDGDHHRVSLRAYKGAQALEGVFGIALRQPGSAAHTQRLTLDYLGNLTIGGALTESSSIKLKENVETSEGNLEKVVNLRPVTYNKIGSQTKELGLIAEEVATVYPEFVQYDESGEPVGVNYSRLTAALIGAVKELTQRIEILENNG